ncbi:hypothetical protein FC60_GL001677 [Limosilactobacillus gastricus DSM 16045]|uniref:Gram-positive cocci surface proteins LPxTG domain-containing protein n=2 Tax=Limosilactobacillus gastricus TaxID=227942 RepID=A0A0R1VAY5_9LACO|nr:YSIRK-type signal peptide-containing protein [Limosilactobacillus gastricus]KRM02666.1 hypothetical protein FC60_GL001677 [Limosilactobacillus gastricus DSM 16045]
MLGKNNINGKPMNVLRAQQRFGLRKLNIGVASVLLGTTFLFVNGTNALADSSSSLTTADTTTTSLNSSAASNTSSSAQVTDNASASSTSTATSTPTSSSTDSTSNDTASAVVTTMSAAVDTTDDGEITADSQEVFDNSISLSKTTTGNDGSTSPITISLNLTGNAGDTFTLQIPKNATYGQPSYGSLTGTVGTTTLTSDNNYWYVKYLLTANASFQDKVVLSETNNYAAQAKPISNIGTNELVMTLSGVNSDGESVGSTSKTYTSIITPGMNPQFTRDNPSTSTASSIAVNTNYRYLLKINEANGVQDSNSYASNQINSADNYGTIITIPVPSSFQLDESATATANAFTDQTTISQPNGIGTDIIITVPKGSGKQGYEGAAGYYLIGSYQTTTPSTDTVVSANAPITIVQKLDDEGSQTLTATAGTWTETLRGEDNTTSKGELTVSASGAASSNTLLLDDDSSNDPTYINEFGFGNNSILNLTDAEITIKIADGLMATGITTPVDSKNLTGVTSYDYTLTYADGTTSAGTVAAGETVSATGSSSIRTAVFKPNLVNVGDTTATATYNNVTSRTDEFKVLGKISKTYDDGSAVKSGDKLSSSITDTSASLSYVKDGSVVYPSWGATNTQQVIGEEDLVAAQNIFIYQANKTPGTDKAGYISVTNENNSSENTNTIKEPTYYYVLPQGVTYNAAASDFVGSPTVSTFWVGNQQVVKIDYSGTGYYLDTSQTVNRVWVNNSNTATTGTYTIPIYVTTATNMLDTKVSSLSDFNSDFTEGQTDNTYLIGSGSWTITQAAALYTTGMAKGNSNDWYVNKGTSNDKGSTAMSYEVAVVNALSTTATNIHVYINVPKTTSSTNFKFDLTGPVTTDYSGNYTILYSTKAFSTSATAEPTSSNYVTADQVTDWSAIKSIEIQVDEIAGNSSAGYFYLNGTDATLASDVNKSASLAFLVTATGYDKPQIVAAGSSGSPSITISGTSTIKTVLEYVDANGVSQTVNLDYSKTYTDGTSVVRKTDFPWSTNYASWFDAHDVAIINNLLNQGYAIDSDNFPANTLENGSVTWQDGESNQTATFNVKAAYYFDDDKVVYKLRQVTANVSSVPTAGVTQLTDLQTGQTTTYPANTPVNSPVNDANSYTNHATATRTVQYVFEGNATNKPSVADVVQTINYESYNTYTVNLVTGAVLSTTTSDWTPVSGTTSATNTTIDENGQLTQTGAGDITDSTSIVPAVSGTFAGWYLDSSSNAGSTSLSVNQNTTGQLVYKHYQGATINYLDADNNDAILTTISVSGKQGDTIDFDYSQNLQNLLDQGYVLASSDYQTGATFDSDDNSDQTFTVKLVHGTTDSTETKTITRTIKVTNPDGSVTITTQPVTLSRTVTTDQVTGNKTYSDWTSGEWEDYTTPNIAGYTPTISSVAEMTVTSDLSDQTVQITYTPNQQQAQVNLIDQTTGAVLSQDALIGKSDQAIDFSTPNSQLAYYLAHGYQLASNNSNVTGDTITPTDYDRDDDETQVINVYLVHATVETTESKTVTRTINVHNPDGTVTTEEQPVTITRSVTTDLVTGEKTYGDWTSAEWPVFVTPTIAGYTPSTVVVMNSKVDGTTNDQTVNIGYRADQQLAAAIIIDDTTGQRLNTFGIFGPSDSQIDFSEANAQLAYYLAHGYVLSTQKTSDITEGVFSPSQFDHDDQQLQTFTVYLCHGTSESTEMRTVTRIINVTNPDGSQTTTSQPVELTRTVTTDLVTNQQTIGDWTSGQWSAYLTPTIKGYTPSQSEVDSSTVDGTTQDQIVNISYTADPQTAIVKIFDETTGVELGQRELNGTTGAKIDFTSSNNQLAYYLAHGYQLANDNSVITDNAITPANYNNDPDDVQTFTINLVHASQISQESKIITRTITIIKPDGTSDTLEQPITLTRQVETDQVTGDQTYGDWSTDEWPAFVVPVVDGYTPSQASVARENVDGDTNNQTVTITYQPNTQVATVELIDQTSGKTLQSLNLTGNSDSAIDFADANTLLTEYLKQGYQLANQNPQLTNGLLTPTNYDHDDTVDQDFKVYLVHQTSQSEESKTITRTIRIHKPDQTTEVIEQPVTLKRTITTDQVTGDQSFSAWSTADWEQYQLPTVNGYRPSQVMIDSAVVTGDSSDQTIDVTYQANQQVATIKFIDDTTGETLSSQTITGPSNSAMDLKQTQDLLDSYWKQGYMLSTNNPDVNNGRLITRNFDADDQVDQELVIHLVHSTTTTDDPRTITRTINITQPDGQTSTEVQSVTINRTIITDNVTKVASIGDWTTGEWSQYSVPSISGYTPSQGQVDATTVDCETNDQVVNINYLPNAQLVQVNFIDQTTGQTIRTFDINGLSDASINFSAANQQLANYLEQGYALADDNHDLTTDLLNPANYDHDDQVNQTFNVYLVHQTEVTTETKTVTRTINLMLPDGTTKVIEQPVTLSRTVTTDQVTGDQEFGAWSTGDWEAYQVSAMSGYHPSQFTINSATVNGDSSDQTITVTYQADPQIAQVTFIDQTTGQELQTINLTGVSDAAIDFSAANDQLNDYLNHGYVLTADNHDLTDGELAPTDYDHDDQVNQGFNVYLKHATLTTTENKTLTRTINVQLPDGTTTVIKQPTTLSRSVTTDQVTGDQAYGEWSTGEWDAYQVPDITGYTPSQMTIDQVPVNGDASDQTVNVSYQADPRTATIEFVDKSNGTVLATLTTNGGVNEAIDFTQANQTLASLLQDGYMLSSDNQSITNQQLSPATYNLAGDQFFTVNLVHQPKSVITTQESRKITRTILLWLPKGEVESVVQTAVISRMVMTDEETGEQTYGDWSNADWPAYTVPEVDGYTPTQTNVSESDVNGNTSDQTITISYQSDPQVATVTFVDQTNGKVLQTTNLTGESNDKIDFSTVNDQLATYLEQGYELGSQNPDVRANQLIPADFDQDPQVNQNFTVYLTHQTDSSTEKQTITRTIKVHLPNGTVTTVVQPATLTRTVTTDQVSGQQTTSDWSTGEWEAYQVPTIAGYTASQLTVDQTSVNADTTNQVIDVSYQADPQVAQVIFVDQTSGQSIQTVTLTGRSDEVIDFTSINEMIRAYLAAGYDLALVNPDLTNDQVTSTKYDHNDSTNQAFQIFLVHQFSEGQESKTVARTITLHLPDGTNQVIKQPVTLTRSVTTDLVTGQSSYGEWSTSSWPVYAVNTIDGYTASLAQVESEIVNSTTADEAIDIYYLADSPAEQATSNTITTSQTSTNANLSNDKLVKLSPTKANSQQTTSNRRMKLPQTGNNYDAALLGLGLASTAALISMLGFSKKKDEHS